MPTTFPNCCGVALETKSTNKATKKKTKKETIDETSDRLLNLEFKSNNSMKTKLLRRDFKKILPKI